jgi:hypothetical protein
VRSSVIGHLILKDWQLNRTLISLSTAVGLVALVIAQYGGQRVRLVGSVWFFISLCILASMLPGSAIVSERRKQTLAFIMSLPVSSVQYSVTKALSTLAMFLVPWLTLLVSAVVVIEMRHVLPRGIIPMLLILAMLPLLGFCIIFAAALVGESDGWVMAAGLLCNSSYWLVLYLLGRTPSLAANWRSPTAVWNPAAFVILSSELALAGLILALTFFLQSRKRDFI